MNNAEILEKYKNLSHFEHENACVLLGGNFFYDMPLGELAQIFGTHANLLNRSFPNLSMDQAPELLKECLSAAPKKILINLGDHELASGMPMADVIEKYEWMLYQLHTLYPDSTLIITSLAGNAAFNAQLKTLSDNTGCTFVSLEMAYQNRYPYAKTFSIIKSFLHEGRLSMGDAMGIVTV